MYEPIHTKSVRAHGPHRSREEELEIRLAGHLTALLTVTDELRALQPSAALDEAARGLSLRVERLGGGTPLRAAPTTSSATPARIAALHQRAHTLAGQALVVATQRGDAAGAALAAERMHAHAAALGIPDAA
ncbi:SCO4983 family protein [Streptomyces griseocarneus]|uniref:SCO4983 family protein n=1 Tax=Streptomyces griseocarneus TaxID=51201 RepID=UPI00167E7943|nr:hypothetical protein [Streptomyces griseocarneus]MBZ6476581.1 hypothetical protein [Streptomyces griseocarneus]GHG79607.1 hypothetical protein GCM10018779_60480 [Streptomyces griseocarneus]